MRRHRTLIVFGVVASLVVASCSSAGVEITRSDQREPTTTTIDPPASDPPTSDPPPTEVPTTEPGTTDPGSADPPPGGDLPDIGPATWTACPDQPAPWQCATILVPMDYSRTDGRLLTIALTRLPAADDSVRIGSLVLNPGGPGGSGLVIAYDEAASFPDEILDRFDIVGFDPRGVGASTSVDCPPDFDPATDSLQPCIDLTGELLAYLGTPNVARDLEMVRKAVGDDQLTYLGYSYGTALGAVYADLFPDRIRALVLDGAIDPDAGLSNTPGGGGYDFYAEQDFDGTLEVFHTLCDATTSCLAGPDSRDLLDRVYDEVRDTPAPYFADGNRLSRSDVDDIVYTSMYSAFNWPILGVALRDASDGDASTLAAMYSWLQFGYPADMEIEPDYEFANVAIRCADFSNRGSGSFECEEFPDTTEALPVITAIDASTPIVVIGTQDDPATPGRYADLLADALGDAVDITWEGAGHTAYLTSGCITDLVTAYLIDQQVPADGDVCPFVTDAPTLPERADVVFADLGRQNALDAIEPLLDDGSLPDRLVRCVAEAIVDHDDERLIVHQVLGVESPELVGLRNASAMRCQMDG